MFNREDIKTMLRGGIHEVVFTKKDGTERVMKCTLSESIIPQEHKPKENSTHKANDTVLAVFDVEKQGWRSFSIDSVISVV